MKIITFLMALFACSTIVFAEKPAGFNPKDDDDVTTVKTIYETLMKAEKHSKPLNLDLYVNETVNSIMTLSMESQETQDVTLSLAKVGETEKSAEREFQISSGKTYKAMNVMDLPDGNYILTISKGDNKVIKLIGILREKTFDEN